MTEINRLLSQIHDFEIAHKSSHSPHIYADMVNARDQPCFLLDQSYTRQRDKSLLTNVVIP